MEPNDSKTHQGSGTRPPPQSPPLSRTSSPQQADTSGSEQNSRSGGKSDPASGSASELGVEVKKAAQAKAREGADTARRTVSSTASHGADALGRAAESFRDQGEETLAQTTTSIASGLSDYAERLEKRTGEDLIQDLVRLARENPALFVLSSVGIGIAISRFFRASSKSTGGYS